jgi:hypothetical protein
MTSTPALRSSASPQRPMTSMSMACATVTGRSTTASFSANVLYDEVSSPANFAKLGPFPRISHGSLPEQLALYHSKKVRMCFPRAQCPQFSCLLVRLVERPNCRYRDSRAIRLTRTIRPLPVHPKAPLGYRNPSWDVAQFPLGLDLDKRFSSRL